MSESTVEKSVVGVAENDGWLSRKCQWIGRRGAPDRLFAKNGRFLFIEFKDRGEEPDIHQEREIKRMREAGIEVHVVDNIRDGLKILGLKSPRPLGLS
jgi:hypothetical protein